MSRYLILGNGFDLAHNLPTSYKDFLYVCAEYIELPHNIKVGDNIEKVKNGFIQKYKDDLEFKELVKNNSWLKIFFDKINEMGNNWIDFEKEIKHQCETIVKEINNIFANSILIQKNIIALKADLKDLVFILNRYLVIVNKIEINECYSDVINFMPTHIINFNYTNTFSRAYKKLAIDYIHGRINIKDKSTIVLGFEGMNNENNDIEFGEFLKYIQMVQNDIVIDCYAEMQKSSDNESTFFGHSLDETDKDIIMKIIECSSRVNILYKDNDMKNSIIKNLIKIYGRKEFISLTLSKDKKIYFIQQSDSQIGKKEDIELIYYIFEGKYDVLSKMSFNADTVIDLINKYKINIIPVEILFNFINKRLEITNENLNLLKYLIYHLEADEKLIYRSQREKNTLIRKMKMFAENYDKKRVYKVA